MTMSQNLVEFVRRHHALQAPTALDVLKVAIADHGDIDDEDRRRAAELSGLPEAAVYGVSTFYDNLMQSRGARHLRVRSRTGRIEIDALVTDRIEPGHVFTTFHFPEAGTNKLVGSSADVNTSCPEYKVIAADVCPVAEQPARTPALAGA
jgi:hypothetical protein